MKLKELMQQIHPVATQGTLDREITGIAYDSRRITPGMLFVAIRGQQVDGHDFIPNAVDRGASAIVCERNGLVPSRASTIRVANAREALAHTAATFYGHPSSKLKMIGVTGTNGKTTVAFLIKHILEVAGISTGLISTVRYEIGERMVPAHRTTPEALEVQQMLGQMIRENCAACVMEVSSHALEQARVEDVEFDLAVFTNLTQDHLDYHGTMDNYYTAKKRLFVEFGSYANPGLSVVNTDDPFGRRLADELEPVRRLCFGRGSDADFRAVSVHTRPTGTHFVIRWGEHLMECEIPLIGGHNVSNALAAAGAALALKVERSDVVSALRTMPQVPGRLERVDQGQPFGVFVDYAHTEDALRNVLATLKKIASGRLLLAFGCGGNRDMGKRSSMGRAAAELADFTLVTSDNPRNESPQAIAAEIEAGYRAVRDDGIAVELDRRTAIERIVREAREGDLVLIAGKGHETYQEFNNTVVPFDDRIHARDTLETLGHPNK